MYPAAISSLDKHPYTSITMDPSEARDKKSSLTGEEKSDQENSNRRTSTSKERAQLPGSIKSTDVDDKLTTSAQAPLRHRTGSQTQQRGLPSYDASPATRGGRFSWVRRLMNNTSSSSSSGSSSTKQQPMSASQRTTILNDGTGLAQKQKAKKEKAVAIPKQQIAQLQSPISSQKSIGTNDYSLSDNFSYNSQDEFSANDNISTIPILSLSSGSFNTRYDHEDELPPSGAASTTATSFAPTVLSNPHTQSHNSGILLLNGGAPTGLDSASVITIASSTRHRRRRSIDTNASISAIPPASIFERIIPSNTAASINTNTTTMGTNSRYNVSTGMSHEMDSLQDVKSTKSLQTSYTSRTNEESSIRDPIEA